MEMDPLSDLDAPLDHIPSSKMKAGLFCDDASDSDLDIPFDRPARSARMHADLSDSESAAPSDSDMDVPNDRRDGDQLHSASATCFGVLSDPGLFPAFLECLPAGGGSAEHDDSCVIEPVHASGHATLLATSCSRGGNMDRWKELQQTTPVPTGIRLAGAHLDESLCSPGKPGLFNSPSSPPVVLEAVRVSEAPFLISRPVEAQRVVNRPTSCRPPPALGRRPCDMCVSPSPSVPESGPVELLPSPNKAPISSPRELNESAGHHVAEMLRFLPSPLRRRRAQPSWDVASSTCRGDSLEFSFSGEGVSSTLGTTQTAAHSAVHVEGTVMSSIHELPTLSSREILSLDSWLPLSPRRPAAPEFGRVLQPGIGDVTPQTPALSSPMSLHATDLLATLPPVPLPLETPVHQDAASAQSPFSQESCGGVDEIAISRIHTLYDVSLGTVLSDASDASEPNIYPALSHAVPLDPVQLDPVRLHPELLDAVNLDHTSSVMEISETIDLVNPLSAVTTQLEVPHGSFDGLPTLFLDVHAEGSEDFCQKSVVESPNHVVDLCEAMPVSSQQFLSTGGLPDVRTTTTSTTPDDCGLSTPKQDLEAELTARTPTSQASTAVNDKSQSSDNDSAETAASVRVGPCPELFSPGLCSRAPRCGLSLRWETTAGTMGALHDIPEDWTRAVLLEMLDDFGFEQQYTCLYMPVDVKQRQNFGYAFLTMTGQEPVERAAKLLDGKASWAPPSLEALHASWTSPDHGLCTPPSPTTPGSGPDLARERIRQRFAAECAPLWFRDGEVVDPPESELSDSPESVVLAPNRVPSRVPDRPPNITPVRAMPPRAALAKRTPSSGARAHRCERGAAGSGRPKLVAPKRLSWPPCQVEERLAKRQADEGATN